MTARRLRIALVSYEYPPDTALGGVARCTHHAARMLAARGHDVEVFAGSAHREGAVREDGVLVHRVRGDYIASLEPMGAAFARRHAEAAFDVLEGPELEAEAAPAARRCPDVPLLVRLHSSTMLIWEGNRLRNPPPPWPGRMRETLAARRRGFPPYWAARDRGRDVPDVILAQDARERAHALAADVVVAPSRAVRDRTAGRWGLDPARVRVVPHPFTPDPALLSIPPGRTAGAPPVVTFLGRLEPNKGVIDLALALRTVAARMPGARFRLVGGGYDGGALGDVRRYVRDCMLHHLGDAVEVPGPVPPQEVPAVLAAADVVVIPSIWDNFPYTCLEAMAAARAVVATDSGGMREMLDDGCGWLVPPRDPGALAAALLAVLADPGARAAAGARARRRLLGAYAADVVAGDWEEAYAAAIARRRAPDRERAA